MSDDSSESGSEFEIRQEAEAGDDSESDDNGPSWMLGEGASSTSAPKAATRTSTAAEPVKTAAEPVNTAAEPVNAAAEPGKRAPKEDVRMDAFLGALMSEVNGLKTGKKKKLEQKFAAPEEIIERLMSKETMSAFEVLMIAPDATDGEITKMYRKVSFLVHPDKCKHPRAHDAFQKVAKAYEELKDPTYKEKYKDVIEQAKSAVVQFREKENEDRDKSGEEKLGMDGVDFDQAVVAECERMLNVTVEQATYAEKVRAKNEDRIEVLQKERKKRERSEMTDKKKWEVNRDKRVAGWQVFRNNIDQKKFKNLSSGRIGVIGAADRFHTREQRTELDEEQLKKKKKNEQTGDQKGDHKDQQGRPAGVDFSFKTAWR
eukprot:GEMP01052700.1.p1 GENE.GEMP01052700.1~~GEMP01052700.1.p1  ORF type:complete len:373 (+),score=120.64 GEMP01052700.1:149-1267(+)